MVSKELEDKIRINDISVIHNQLFKMNVQLF